MDLQGSNRSSGPRMLVPSFSGAPGGIFWRGQIELLLPDLGRLSEAVVGHNKLPQAPGWHLDLVSVEEAATGKVCGVPGIPGQPFSGCGSGNDDGDDGGGSCICDGCGGSETVGWRAAAISASTLLPI